VRAAFIGWLDGGKFAILAAHTYIRTQCNDKSASAERKLSGGNHIDVQGEDLQNAAYRRSHSQCLTG
jgi:hypothetical protein